MIERTIYVFLQKSLLPVCLIFTGMILKAQPYSFYYGNIHAHSGYSDGNQDSVATMHHTPAQDYDYAMASAHFDFLGISDHNHSTAGMSLAKYHLGVTQAQAANTPGVFAAFYGMEYGVINNGGHVLVYGIDSLIGWQSGNYDIFCGQYNYAQLFGIVNAHAGAFCSLAHPQTGDYTNLTTTAYNAAADNAISGTCVRNGSAFSTTTDYSDPPATSYEAYYKTLLGRGYHVGPSIDHDNHNTTFGRTGPGRTVVLASSLDKADILSALDNMRYYGSDDWNIEVNYTVNGLFMGSIADVTGNPTLSVSISDPDGESTSLISVYYGVPGSNAQPVVLTSASNTNTLTYTHSISIGNTYYYYLKIQQTDGDVIWTAPIWAHKVSAPLPLDLSSLTATPFKESVRVEWTANVHSPGIFEVEHSVNGFDFETVGKIMAKEKSSPQSYFFDHTYPIEGLNFYRLREVDADGTEEYSPIVTADWRNPDLVMIAGGPNPVSDFFTLRFQSQKEEEYWYFLYDEDGREVRRNTFAARHGENVLTLDMVSFPAGQYFLILGSPGRRILETKLTKTAR